MAVYLFGVECLLDHVDELQALAEKWHCLDGTGITYYKNELLMFCYIIIWVINVSLYNSFGYCYYFIIYLINWLKSPKFNECDKEVNLVLPLHFAISCKPNLPIK